MSAGVSRTPTGGRSSFVGSTRETVTLLIVLAAAFALRAFGAGLGLPEVYHQDEPMLVHRALEIGVAGPHPRYFILPSFAIYTLFLLYGGLYAIGHLAGVFADASAFAESFIRNPSLIYGAGRLLIGVGFGTASVAALWRLARERIGVSGALWAAFLLAVAHLHVHESRYIYADIPLTFFLILFFHRVLILIERPSVGAAALAGAWLGLAMAVKYNAVFAVVPVLAIWFAEPGTALSLRRRAELAVAAACVAAVVFFVWNPFILIDWPGFVSDWTRQIGSHSFVGYLHHLRYSLAGGLGWPFLVAAALGIVPLFRADRRLGALAAGFVVFYYFVCVFRGQPHARYMTPLVPFICLFAGAGLSALWGASKGRVRIVAAAALTAAVLAVPVAADLAGLRLDRMTDTRTLMKSWIEKNIPAGAPVALDHSFFGPHLTQDPELRLTAKTRAFSVEGSGRFAELYRSAVRDRKTYRVFYLAPDSVEDVAAFTHPAIPATRAALDGSGIRYVVFNFHDSGPAMQSLRERVRQSGKLLATFSPYRDAERKHSLDRYATTADPVLLSELLIRNRPGPYLELYEIGAEAAS